MKKVLSGLILLLMLVLVLASCQIGIGGATTGSDENPLEAAKEYLHAMYRNDSTVTPSDYAVVNVVAINGVSYTVTWSVEILQGEETDVVIGEGEKNYQALIDVNEKSVNEIKYNLIATISDGEGNTVTQTFAGRSVPGFKISSWAEYVAAAKNDPVVVQGVVTGIISKSKGATSNGLYLMDNDGGYYVYNMEKDPVADLSLEVGMSVMATGVKDIYSGTHEVVKASVEILDVAKVDVVPVDYTDLFANAASLTDAALVEKQSLLVTIKDVEIMAENETDLASGYYMFKLGALESYIRISGSTCPLNKDDQNTFKANHAANTGFIADATGVVCLFNGAFYLTPVDVNAFTYKGLPERSDAEKAEFEKEILSLTENITENGDITVPVVGKSYDNVTISWASNDASVVVNGDKLTATLPEEAKSVIITATITCGETTVTREFTVLVDAASTTKYIAQVVTAVADGTYKFMMDQSAVAGYGVLYTTGVINSKGALETTDKADKAVDVIVAAVEGGYTLQIGDKYLEGYLNDTYKNMRLVDTAAVWGWNEDAHVFTCAIDGKDYYFGSYYNSSKGTVGNTMALSEMKYITGENAGNVGVTQFPAQMANLVEAVERTTPITEGVAGTYVLAMDQSAVEGKGVLYAIAEIDNKGALLTTDKLDKAVRVVVESIEGGFSIKVGEKYLEGYLNGTYKNMRLVDTAAVWTWNEDANTFVCNIDGTNYYFGSYGASPKNTMALSEIKYITGTNAGNVNVTQFPGFFSTVKLVPAAGCAEHAWNAGVETKAATCTVDGVTTYTCTVCGDKKTEPIPAIGHDAATTWSYDANVHYHACANCNEKLDSAAHTIESGVCSVCGYEDGSIVSTAPVAGTAYKFNLVQASLSKTLYFTGAMSGNYLATAEFVADAVDVFVEEVTGGYNIYFMNGTAKTFIEIYEYAAGKAGVHLITDAPTNVFVWNEELQIMTAAVAGDVYYLGTYNTNTSMSASKISYLTNDPSKIGVTQFPAKFDIVTITDADKVAADKAALAFNGSFNADASVDLVLSGANGSVITWAVTNGGDAFAIVDNKLVVTQQSEVANATLTATITLNGASDTKEFPVSVAKAGIQQPTLAGTISFAVANHTNRTSYSTTEEVWAVTNVTLTHAKGSNNLRDTVTSNDSSLRVYGNATLTIACTGIKKIVLVGDSSYSSNDGRLESITAEGATITVDNGNVIITFATPVNSIAIKNTHTSQIRFSSIEVYN